MEAFGNSSELCLHEAHSGAPRRLSLFVADEIDSMKDRETLVVGLTPERQRPPDRDTVEDDSDCACE